MRCWWLKGYLNGEQDLWYPAFVTYGEIRAKQAEEKLTYTEHTFVIEEGVL